MTTDAGNEDDEQEPVEVVLPTRPANKFAKYINPEEPAADRWNTLFGLIQDDDIEEFKEALDLEENAGRIDTLEVEIFACQSIVAHAALFSFDILRYLVEQRRCSVNLRSSGVKDRTPIFNGRGRAVKYLLENGADQFARDVDGDTALIVALRRKDYEQALDFVRSGFSLSVLTPAGDPAVHLALSSPADIGMEAAEDVFWSFFFDVLCVDGSQRAMFSMKDSHGHTCLHIAAAQEREALVRRLLEWGADPDALNNDGSKPRLLAAWTQGITSRVGDAARGADSKHLRHRATHFDDLPETHNQAPHSIRFKDQPDLLNPDASQAPEAAEKELQPPEEDELPQETSDLFPSPPAQEPPEVGDDSCRAPPEETPGASARPSSEADALAGEESSEGGDPLEEEVEPPAGDEPAEARQPPHVDQVAEDPTDGNLPPLQPGDTSQNEPGAHSGDAPDGRATTPSYTPVGDPKRQVTKYDLATNVED
eukprot:GHVT01029237.1.p1 GENE.GHVT01029237.1~~GHVT01029237.1.p1  ORF type:complete len:481 (-),score=134.12 GHVT01029237.1:70-1512(-)